MGQSARYRFVARPPLTGQSPAHTDSEARGLNEKRELVGISYAASANTNTRAFVHLPVGAYGQSAGLLNLNSSLPSVDRTKPSIAWAINESGIVVGQVGTPSVNGMTEAWQLASTITTHNLGTLASGTYSIAYAINNASSPEIVGSSHRTTPCSATIAPFRLTFNTGTGTGTMTELVTAGDHIESVAYDVDTPTSGNPRIVGLWTEHAGNCFVNATPCSDPNTAAQWQGTTRTVLLDLDTVNQVEDVARGNNEAGNIVGWGFMELPDPSPPDACRQHITFHSSAGAALVDLHTDITNPLPDDNQTFGNAINEPYEDGQCLQAVGKSITTEDGALVERDAAGDWTYYDVNGLIGNHCSGDGYLQIIEAHDINGGGLIAVTADINSSPSSQTLRAGVLYCLSDLNLDGATDGADLGILLNHYGSPITSPGCGGSLPCGSDLNCDTLVNGTDLGILLLLYGPDCRPDCDAGEGFAGGGGGGSSSVAETISTPEYQALIQEMVDAGAADAVAIIIEAMLEAAGA
jgi:hypothetical protein